MEFLTENPAKYNPARFKRIPRLTYALQDGRRVKIGISVNLKRRLRGHKTSNPFAALVKTWKGGQLEKLAEKELAFCRIKGTEWYQI